MDLFNRAKAVRLRSHHGKFLVAAEDEEHVTQSRDGSAPEARWEVEFADDRALRFLSCRGRYVAAIGEYFLLGMTGKKIKLALHPAGARLDSSVEWEPLREGFQVKLKSRSSGKFLRANTSLPPWRNSVTHDVPHRTATQDWVLWEVEIVQIQIIPASVAAVKSTSLAEPPPSLLQPKTLSSKATETPLPPSAPPPPPETEDSLGSGRSSTWSRSSSIIDSSPRSSPPNNTTSFQTLPNLQKVPSLDSPTQGRTIYYTVADDRGNVDDAVEWPSLTYAGTSVPVLARKLKQLTGLDDIVVCTRHPVKHTLSPIYLQLPPNNRTLWLVVVDAESSCSGSAPSGAQ